MFFCCCLPSRFLCLFVLFLILKCILFFKMMLVLDELFLFFHSLIWLTQSYQPSDGPQKFFLNVYCNVLEKMCKRRVNAVVPLAKCLRSGETPPPCVCRGDGPY